jgi:hypothetical protein
MKDAEIIVCHGNANRTISTNVAGGGDRRLASAAGAAAPFVKWLLAGNKQTC